MSIPAKVLWSEGRLPRPRPVEQQQHRYHATRREAMAVTA